MLRNYLKIAWNNLRKHRIFSLINIAGLSAGMAASFLLFTIVRYELSYDKNQPNYSQIYHLVTRNEFSTGLIYNGGSPYPAVNALRNDFPEIRFAALDCISGSQVIIPSQTGKQSTPFIENRGIYFCEPDFFKVFTGYSWLSGNEAVLGEPNQVVLTRSTAVKYFGDWQSAMNKTVIIDNIISARVSGILEDGYQNTDIPLSVLVSYMSLKPHGNLYAFSESWQNINSNHQVFALLPEKMNVDHFGSRLETFSHTHYSASTSKQLSFLQPLSEMHFDQRLDLFDGSTFNKSILWILSVVGIVILLMACINFINLSTAQAIIRSKEVGIRKVLGGTRPQLFVQFMGETTMIVTVASLFAIVCAYYLLPVVIKYASIEGSLSLINLPTILMVIIVGLVTVFFAGVYPAVVLSGYNPANAIGLKMTAGSSRGINFRRSLIIAQFSISQILLIATLVVVSQMNFVNTADMGFKREGVLILVGSTDSVSISKQKSFKDALRLVPGVQSVSASSDMPSSSDKWSTNYSFDLQPQKSQVYLKYGDEDYLKTYGISLIAGRNYTPSDTLNEVLVNESFFRKLNFRQASDVVGKKIKFGGPHWKTVVGVVKNFNLSSLKDQVGPLLIGPNRVTYKNMAINIRSHNMNASENEIRKLWLQYYPSHAFNAVFFEDAIQGFYKQDRELGSLFKIFAGLAIFISCIGLYGMIAYMSTQKTKEVGIRKVLGARLIDILIIFSREFTVLAIIAFAIAVPLAWWISNNWLDNFAYRIKVGAWIFLATFGCTIGIAWLTVAYESIKAALKNPVESLRLNQ